MGRGKSTVNKLKAGFGQGTGADYRPWLTVREVPSQGRSTRVKGLKTDREQVFLSDNERGNFYQLQWMQDVTDIREQFPLPLAKTIDLAARLGIRHPKDNKTKEYLVMTTDLVVTKADGRTLAFACKWESEINNPRRMKRILEKLEIERKYWTDLGASWKILTEKTPPKALVKNLMFVRDAYSLEGVKGLPDSEGIAYAAHKFKEALESGQAPIHMCNWLDAKLSLGIGTSLLLLRHFIATRKIRVDMSQPLRFNNPIKLEVETNA